MAFSKVILNGTTLMDVTNTTAKEEDVNYQKVFVKANGNQSTGTNMGIVEILFQQDQNGYVILDDNAYIASATGVSF